MSDRNIAEYNEKWFFKNTLICVCLLIAAFIPFLNIPIILLLFLKNKYFYNYINNVKQQLNAKYEEIDKLTEDANLKAADIIVNANERLTYINSEIDKKSFYMEEIERIKAELESLTKKQDNRVKKIQRLTTIQKSINNSLIKYFEESDKSYDTIITLPPDMIRDINTYAPSVTLKLHNMDYKKLNKAFKANDKIINELLERYSDRYSTKNNQAIYQLMVIALRAELQNLLYTLNYKKLDEALANIKEIINKYLNIARIGNQKISSTLAKFIGELEVLFIDAVKIEYEYYVKKEAARQEQIALREQMRQEAEERRILKEQQAQMEQEASKYKTEIDNIQEQIKSSEDDEKTKQLLAKIEALESQLNDIDKKKDEIVNLQNGKAGYVYVISNLGSFGDNIFKVGMTRRLEPLERIDELGNASVPFKFDVHSLIFSDDAVQLESNLHQALEKQRVNKVNNRKEFFKISLDDLEKLVYSFDPAAEFNKTMAAEQYRQTLSIEEETRTA